MLYILKPSLTVIIVSYCSISHGILLLAVYLLLLLHFPLGVIKNRTIQWTQQLCECRVDCIFLQIKIPPFFMQLYSLKMCLLSCVLFLPYSHFIIFLRRLPSILHSSSKGKGKTLVQVRLTANICCQLTRFHPHKKILFSIMQYNYFIAPCAWKISWHMKCDR